MPTPHRVVDGIASDIAGSAKQLLNGASSTLDKIPAMVGLQGPHHIPKRVVEGFIDGAKAVAEGFQKALDHPVEQFRLPPDLNPGSLRKFKIGR